MRRSSSERCYGVSVPKMPAKRQLQLTIPVLCSCLILRCHVFSIDLVGTDVQPVIVNVTEPVQHGEGPHWDDRHQLLYFVDITQQMVNRYDPASRKMTQVKLEGGGVSFVIPVTATLDQFIVSCGLDILLITWNGENVHPTKVERITSVESSKPDNRFNDGKADRSGRLWAGTMGPEKVIGEVLPNQGTLYSLNPNSLQTVPQVAHVSISNGLVWSSNNKILYYIDTPTLRIDAFDFNIETGNLSNRRPVLDLRDHHIKGFPDGMTIDSRENLWVAVFNAGKVINIEPQTGILLQTIDIPATRVTSVVFGGRHLDVLYVTSSRFGLSDEELKLQPLAGSVFAITELGVRGTRSNTAIRTII